MSRTRLIALDGVCWPGFATACRQGLVPNLARLAAAGATGLVRGVPRQGRLGAATSIATGHWPETHGVWQGEEAWAGGIRPATRASWCRPPVWATLAANGIATASVAWPAGSPGADAPGLHIDDRFPPSWGQTESGWALPPDCCPPGWRDELAGRRIHPTAITARHLLPLLPDLAAVDQDATDALTRLANAMAEAASAQGAAAWVLGQQPDAFALWLRWLGDIRAAATDAPAPWHQVVNGAWRFLDTLVGALADLAVDDPLLIVGAGFGEAPGLVIASGAPAGGVLPPARLTDIAPTLLAGHGLRDATLPGRPLPLPWVRADRPATPPPPPAVVDPAAVAATLAPLLAEGHAPPPPPPPAWHAARAVRLAALLLPRDPVAAEAAADAALALLPEDVAALSLKAWCRLAAGDQEGLDQIGAALLRLAPDRAWGAVARAAAAAIGGDAAAAGRWLADVDTNDAETGLRAALIWLRLNRPAAALPLLRGLVAVQPGRIDVQRTLADALLATGDAVAAEVALRAALAIDPYDEGSWAALAALLGERGRRRDAAAAAAMLAQLRPS